MNAHFSPARAGNPSAAPMLTNADAVPPALRSRPRWVLWKAFPNATDPNRTDKKPVRPDTFDQLSSWQQPHMWLPFADAVDAMQRGAALGHTTGLGFVFSSDCDVFCFDTDIRGYHDFETAMTAQKALHLLAQFPTWAEASLSGNGRHHFYVGAPRGVKLSGSSIYAGGGFIAVTGNAIEGSCFDLVDGAQVLAALPGTGAGQMLARDKAADELLASDPALLAAAFRAVKNEGFGYHEWVNIGLALRGAFEDQSIAWELFRDFTDRYGGEHTEETLRVFNSVAGVQSLGADFLWQMIGKQPSAMAAAAKAQAPGGSVGVSSGGTWSPVPAAVGLADLPNSAEPVTIDQQGNAVQATPEIDGELELSKTNPLESAVHFAKRMAKLVRWRGVFYRWNGRHYDAVTDEAVRSVIWQFLGSARTGNGSGSGAPFSPTSSDVSGVLDALKAVTNYGDIDAPGWLVQPESGWLPRNMIEMANGLFDVATGQHIPHMWQYFCLGVTEVAYVPDAPPPVRFLQFLREAFPDDPEAVECLQEWCGYLMTNDTSMQKMLLLVGAKRGGKGTILRLLEQLVGKLNTVSTTLSSLAGDFGVAPLIGKKLVMIGDAGAARRGDAEFAGEILKGISGEDKVIANRKQKDHWQGTLSGRIAIAANTTPKVIDPSGALASRFLALRFTQSFIGREDPQLGEKLTAELPGIFNWALDGLRRLQARGRFVQPASGADEVRAMAQSGSHAIAFVDECCELVPDAWEPLKDIYARYRAWAKQTGRAELAENTFAQELDSAFMGTVRHYRPKLKDGSRPHSRMGLRIIPVPMIPPGAFGTPRPEVVAED